MDEENDYDLEAPCPEAAELMDSVSITANVCVANFAQGRKSSQMVWLAKLAASLWVLVIWGRNQRVSEKNTSSCQSKI